MLLGLQKYNLNVKYRPGKEMYIADMLSCAFLKDQASSNSLSEYQIFQLKQETQLYREIEEIDPANYVRLSEKGLAAIKVATQQDATLQELSATIQQGWPDEKQETPLAIRAYWPFRDELTAHNNLVFKGTKIIVPKSMQALMLQRIHSSHQGPDASVRRAKDVVFWPGMASAIRHLANQCTTCNDYAVKQQKEPLISTEVPSRPWSIVAQDLFTLNSKSYLITVDFYSDFWELDALPDTSGETIVARTKAHFACYGIPDRVISDNGPQFCSQLYEDFARQWDFEHVTSSPYHNQSNGKAESAIKIAKRLLKKATQDKKDTNLAILAWRNTPKEGNFYSPAQKLHSRRTRTLLPMSEQLLLPEVATNVERNIQWRRQKAKEQYDKGAKQLPLLTKAQTVRIQPTKQGDKWKKAVVVKQVGRRSYLVKTTSGNLYRRNRRYLKSTKESMDIEDSSMEDGKDDELYVPDRQGQPELVTQPGGTTETSGERDTSSENQPNLQQPGETSAETNTNQTVTRTGRVVRPSSRYKDFVKL